MGGVMTTFVGVLGLRMWQLGVRDADQYYLLAEENRISLRLVPPNRGRIYDRAGKIVADNEQAFRITLVREEVEDLEDVLAKLQRLLGLDDEAKLYSERFKISFPEDYANWAKKHNH